MEDHFSSLALSDEEDDCIKIIGPCQSQAAAFQFCMVGMFMTYSKIHFESMRNTLADIWHPLGGVDISDLVAKRYLFRFFNQVDLDRVQEGSLWVFNNHLLVWKEIGEKDDPLLIPLTHSSYWVQVHDFQQGFMSQEMAKLLGNFVGEFLEYDAKVFQDYDKESYMRLQVLIDIRKPLKRRKRLAEDNGDMFYVKFRYEKLKTFCYLCGIIGHTDKFCELRLYKKPDELIPAWDESLRALPYRRRQPTSSWICTMESTESSDNDGISNSAVNENQLAFMAMDFRNKLFSGQLGSIPPSPRNSMDCEGGLSENNPLNKHKDIKKRQRITKISAHAVSMHNKDSPSSSNSVLSSTRHNETADPLRRDSQRQ